MRNAKHLPEWTGETVVILGGGPSLEMWMVEHVRGRCKVVAINRAFEIAPWADWLHASDQNFWKKMPEALEFAGLKTTYQQAIDPRVIEIPMTLKREKLPPFSNPARPIHAGRDSGYQALQLASLVGAARVLLLGYDMRANGNWHGGYPWIKRVQPDWMAKVGHFYQRLAPILAERGTEVINCSTGSALDVFPMGDLRDVLPAMPEAA